MSLFDLFKKNKKPDGTYHRDRSADADSMGYYGEGAASFRLIVQDVFFITGRGTVIVGKIEEGSITVGDNLTLSRKDGSRRTVTVSGIEKFRKIVDTACKGENVGILLENLEKNDIGQGDILEKIF